ncbi:MAG: GTP 3',8-cyclase MoaA [Desulfovibrionales bacterium]
MLKDNHGRQVSYMRISVTDRCNLRCFYCWPKKFVRFIPHEDILTYEEILRLIRIGMSLGVDKVRLTGGEPFARKDFLGFLEQAVALNSGLDLRLTTNATMLRGKAAVLKDMGVKRLNISLDTLDRKKFERITGRDEHPLVIAAIDECLAQGLDIKINAVAMKGVNDDEVNDFLDLAATKSLDVRFIEFMPIGHKTIWSEEYFWPTRDIVATASRFADLRPLERHERSSGPARMFQIGEGPGRFGVISAVSDHFCAKCNRLRITADGRLRTCLFSDKEYRLRPILRSAHLGDEHLCRILTLANAIKPMGFEQLGKREGSSVCSRNMSAIGG